jgi:hypothetical protein
MAGVSNITPMKSLAGYLEARRFEEPVSAFGPTAKSDLALRLVE